MLGLKILQSSNPKNPSSDKINNKKIEINRNTYKQIVWSFRFLVLGFQNHKLKTLNQKHITMNNNNNRTKNKKIKMSELWFISSKDVRIKNPTIIKS